MTIRVLIADDHGILRDGLRVLLSVKPGISVVGEAGDGFEAIDACLALQPDVAILDVAMPGMNGIEAANIISAKLKGTRIVMLSMHSSIEHMSRAFQAGASGYVLKESASSEIIEAIKTVHLGRRYVSAALAHLEREVREQHIDRSPIENLSLRERYVMQLVVEGCSSAEIAGRLHLSPKSVDTYRSRMMRKLGVSGVPALVKFALAHGITPGSVEREP